MAVSISSMIAIAGVLGLACNGQSSDQPGSPKIQPTSPTSPLFEAATRAIPSALTERTYAPDALVNITSLDGYAGYVVELKSDGDTCEFRATGSRKSQLSAARYVTSGQDLITEPVTQKWLEVIADSSYAANLRILAFSGSALKAKRLELTIQDLAKQEVPADRVDLDKLGRLANQTLRPGVCARRFVRAAYLTSARYRFYDKVDIKTALTGLTLVGADGSLYRTFESFTDNLVLAIDLRSFDELESANPPAVKDSARRAIIDTGLATRRDTAPRQRPVTVNELLVEFRTTDENKDDDSRLTVSVVRSSNSAKLAEWTQPGDLELKPGSTYLVKLPIGKLVAADLPNTSMAVCIAPVGHDTWRFGMDLTAAYSNGKTRSAKVPAVELTESRTCFTMQLSNL